MDNENTNFTWKSLTDDPRIRVTWKSEAPKRSHLRVIEGGSTEASKPSGKEFPPYFYEEMTENELAFIEGRGLCDFTLCYWRAVTSNALIARDDDMVAMLSEHGCDVYFFHADGTLKLVHHDHMFQ